MSFSGSGASTRGPGTIDVWYFNKQDAGRADALVAALRELGIPGATRKYIWDHENSPNIRPCHYEI